MDWVKVTSRRGEVHARAYLTEGVHPKTCLLYTSLWVTLKTCGVAIVFVFFLGLAAAYFTLRISKPVSYTHLVPGRG